MLAPTPVTFRPKEDIAAVAHLYGQGWSLARLCNPGPGSGEFSEGVKAFYVGQELQFQYGDVRSPVRRSDRRQDRR